MPVQSSQPDELIFSLIDDVGQLTHASELAPFLSRIVEVYDLRHAVYCGFGLPGRETTEPYLALTYAPEWVEHYKAQNYFLYDPVLSVGIASILPFDWRRLVSSTRQARTMFGEAREFGIGRQGLTFPVRGRSGETALFSINADRSDAEWDQLLRRFTRDFQILAFHIHHMVLRANGAVLPSITLGRRETECLQWVAQGKSVWETAKILSLSSRTVRFYLDLARHKLGATNITHAVAAAVGLGLIRAPSVMDPGTAG